MNSTAGSSGPEGSGGSRGLAVAFATLALMAATAPFIARSAITVLGREGTTPIDWVPDDFAPRQRYAEFTRVFESGDVVVVTWPGCELGSPALGTLAAAATGPDAPGDAAGNRWFDAVATGPLALEKLTAPPLSLARDQAVDRLAGMLVGPDGRTTCAVVGFTPAGLAERRRAVDWLRETVAAAAGVDATAVQMAGTVTDHIAIDRESSRSFNAFALPAGLVVLALTWWSLRSPVYAALVVAVSLWCAGLSFATIELAGDRMNGVLIVMPVLVLVLGVSGGIHLVNCLREALAAGREGVAARAVRTGWLPCLLSAGTTAIGLMSLVVSGLEPIRAFGFHSAVGVMASFACTFLVLPPIFERWPAAPSATGTARWPRVLSAFVVRHAGPLTLGFAVAMALAAVGLPAIRTSVRIDTLFDSASPVIRAYAGIERAIGPLVPIEVLVQFDDAHEVRADERLALTRAVERALGDVGDVSGVLSAATFLPDMPEAGAVASAVRKVVAARRLERELVAVDDMKYVRRVPGGQVWRVTARVPALADIDYGDFLTLVRAAVELPVTAAGGAARGISFECTGVMPLVHSIQKTLLSDLFVSFVSALGLITLVMVAVERSVVGGLIAMVGNVFPMVLLFGFLGWTRKPLDIGSVMTASVALGMAIDGTLHFLTFYRRSRAAGGDRATAVRDAFDHSAAALAQGSLVCGVGMLVFAASTFAPTARFAWMMAGLLAAALVGDLVLLPALLAGPVGRRLLRPARA